MERIKISFQKNLNRVNYFINQLLCWFGFLINLTSIYGLSLVLFISKQQQNQVLATLATALLTAALIATIYLITLWTTNIQGRFNNLQIANKGIAWLLYILAFATFFTTLLQYSLYFLPPGFFAKNFLKGKKHEATN